MNHCIHKLATATTLLIVLSAAGNLFAQASGCGKDRNVATQALDEFTWKQLNLVYEEVGKEH